MDTKVTKVVPRSYGLIAEPPVRSVKAIKRVTNALKASALPMSVSLRSRMPPATDQGSLGACTGHAVTAAFAFASHPVRPDGTSDAMWTGSPLFVYYNARAKAGTVAQDCGATLSGSVAAMQADGVCGAQTWPYDITQFAVKPTAAAYTEAAQHQVITAVPIPCTEAEMKQCLADGFPFVLGILVYPSFESTEVALTGVVPMPQASEVSVGGHAVCVVGYDDATKKWLVRNSWGALWGQGGYFTLDYAYLEGFMASDAWKILAVETTDNQVVSNVDCACVPTGCTVQ